MDSKVEVTASALARRVVSLGEPVDSKVEVIAGALASFVDSVGKPVDSRVEVSASARASFVDECPVSSLKFLKANPQIPSTTRKARTHAVIALYWGPCG